MIQISIRDVALLWAPLLKITGKLDQSADSALYSWLCFHVTMWRLMCVIHQSKTGPTAAPQIQTKEKPLWLLFLETCWFQVTVKEHFLSNHLFMCRETSHRCIHEYQFTASSFISKWINANRTTINKDVSTHTAESRLHSVCTHCSVMSQWNTCLCFFTGCYMDSFMWL